MKLIRRIALGALLMLSTFGAAAPAAAAETSASVIPTAGGAGTTFRFSAIFNPDESIALWLTAPDGTVIAQDEVATDDGGVARWEWVAPADALIGTWRQSVRPLIDGLARQTIVSFQVTSGTATPAPADSSVAPSSGGPGTRFAFAAGGFEPGEVAGYWLTTPDGKSIGAENFLLYVDKDGRASWSWTAPADASSGIWLMNARGRNSQTERSVRFTVTGNAAPAAPPASSSVTPTSGKAGTSFAFALSGFAPGERVSYWLTTPDGKSLGDPSYVAFADDSGALALTWTAPDGATPGVWLLVGSGAVSKTTQSVRFQIEN